MPDITNAKNRRSIRIKEYDYAQDGAYFITSCTRARKPCFDVYPKLKDIVQSEWNSLPERFPSLMTDAFVIMPNHIHAILILNNVGETQSHVGAGLDPAQRATSRVAPTIGMIIGAFKSLSMRKWAKHLLQNHLCCKESIWQRNYFEHIIRNESELNLIREYIICNPLKWSFDSDNPNHIYDQEYFKKWEWLEGKK